MDRQTAQARTYMVIVTQSMRSARASKDLTPSPRGHLTGGGWEGVRGSDL